MVALQRQIIESDGRETLERMREKNFSTLKRDSRLGQHYVPLIDNYKSKAEKGGGSIVDATMTTDRVDLDREVVLPGGMDDHSYMATNKNLFVDHMYTALFVVGRMRKIQPLLVTGKLRGHTMQSWLRPSEQSEYARTIRDMMDAPDGGCGISIGFEALDWGMPTKEEAKAYPGAESIVRRYRLLEVSYTFMPCNVDCQTQRAVTDVGKALHMKSRLAPYGEKVLTAFGLAGLVEAPKPKPQRIVVVVD